MDEAGQPGNSQGAPVHSGQTGPQHPVFISYASHDALLAQKVCSALEAAGFPCWIAPRDVVPGTLYAEGIVGALDESRVLVLVLSKDAVASAHVGKELERATSKRHPIIALRTDAAPLTPAFEYFLNESQWIDASAGGSDAGIAKLVEAVRRHLAAGSAAPTQIQAAQVPAAKAFTAKRVWGIAAAVVMLALVSAYFLVDKAWLHGNIVTNPATVAISDKSIAVLPFVDMSEKKDQEYFADGMAEEITDLLTRIPGLKVIGRTSSFQFKGKTEDLRKIGTELGVAYVLEGSVRKSGDRLRVTAQLIDCRNGTHLLSQSYDRDLSDILKMQDEIAIKVARAFQIELVTRDFISRPALNLEAYTLYLRGMHADERFEPQGWEQAVNDFKRALDLDPSFREAAAAAAAEYQYGGQVGYVSREVAFEKTRQFADLALKLDPKFVEAHALLGSIYGSYAWDWAAANKEIELALALAPNHPGALWAATVYSLTLGRWDDALKFALALQEVDPLSPNGYYWLSWGQLRRGQFAEAEAAIRRTLDLSPTYTFGSYSLGLVLLARNQPQAALEAFLQEPSEAARFNGSALAYFALGRQADSDGAFAKGFKNEGNFPSSIASVYAFRGETDEAFKWLDRAYEQKDPLLYGIKYRTEFDKLHGDPRYKAFLKKMNLPE
jgi:TolB-like protein/tetratricopeptide (TPR) repeat protein